jgi:hypothetical protein
LSGEEKLPEVTSKTRLPWRKKPPPAGKPIAEDTWPNVGLVPYWKLPHRPTLTNIERRTHMNADHVRESIQAVTAVLNYSVDTGKRPQIINSDYSKNDLSLAPYHMPVTDAGTSGFKASLTREGFCRVDDIVDIRDITTSPEAAERYRAHLVPLMLELTGADEIIVQAGSVRRQAQLNPTLRAPVPGSIPVNFVHSDFTPKGAAQAEARYPAPSRRETRRKAMFNMWKLLSPGPTNIPLALCDSSSVLTDDIILGDSNLPDGSSFETAFFRHNKKHRWYYYSDLTAEQLLVFKQSDTDANFPAVVPHTAFNDDSRPPAASRVSIETRCLAVWFS